MRNATLRHFNLDSAVSGDARRFYWFQLFQKFQWFNPPPRIKSGEALFLPRVAGRTKEGLNNLNVLNAVSLKGA
jgi:hypothetical protein